MSTRTDEISGMRLISHHDLNGFGNIGEGVALHQASDGRRIYYMAHESAPKDFTSVDVTDIKNPRLIAQTELDYPHLRSNSLAIYGDTMLIAYQSGRGETNRLLRRGRSQLQGMPLSLVGRRGVRPFGYRNSGLSAYQPQG